MTEQNAAARERPLWPDAERDFRRVAVIVVGCFLILGYLLPTLVPVPDPRGVIVATPVALNQAALTASEMPAFVRFLLLYPLAAGLAVIVLALVNDGLPRGVGLLAVGTVGLATPWLGSRTREVLTTLTAGGFPLGPVLTGLAAWVLLVVAVRTQFYRPRMRRGYVAGLAAAALYAAALIQWGLTQTDTSGSGAAPTTADADLLLIPVVLFLVQAAGTLAACVLCVINTPGRPPAKRSALAFAATLLLAFGTALGMLGLTGLVVTFTPADGPDASVLAIVWSALKFECWSLGLLLLIPFGITDLLIGSPFTEQRDAGIISEEEYQRRKRQLS